MIQPRARGGLAPRHAACRVVQSFSLGPTRNPLLSPQGSSSRALPMHRSKGSREEGLNQAKNLALSEGGNQGQEPNTFLQSQSQKERQRQSKRETGVARGSGFQSMVCGPLGIPEALF